MRRLATLVATLALSLSACASAPEPDPEPAQFEIRRLQPEAIAQASGVVGCYAVRVTWDSAHPAWVQPTPTMVELSSQRDLMRARGGVMIETFLVGRTNGGDWEGRFAWRLNQDTLVIHNPGLMSGSAATLRRDGLNFSGRIRFWSDLVTEGSSGSGAFALDRIECPSARELTTVGTDGRASGSGGGAATLLVGSTARGGPAAANYLNGHSTTSRYAEEAP